MSRKIHISPLVAIFLTFEAMSFSFGCVPSWEQDDGKCHADRTCNNDARCNDYWSPPPDKCSDKFVSEQCAPDETALICTSTDMQESSNCIRQAGVDGGILYCCPPCWQYNVCTSPGSGFRCTSSHNPVERDASLHCAVTNKGSITEYCCGPNDGCFPLYRDNCPDGGHAYTCTDDAGPPEDAGECEGRAVDADVSNQYCCIAPASVDASADASDASDDAPDDAGDE